MHVKHLPSALHVVVYYSLSQLLEIMHKMQSESHAGPYKNNIMQNYVFGKNKVKNDKIIFWMSDSYQVHFYILYIYIYILLYRVAFMKLQILDLMKNLMIFKSSFDEMAFSHCLWTLTSETHPPL